MSRTLRDFVGKDLESGGDRGHEEPADWQGIVWNDVRNGMWEWDIKLVTCLP